MNTGVTADIEGVTYTRTAERTKIDEVYFVYDGGPVGGKFHQYPLIKGPQHFVPATSKWFSERSAAANAAQKFQQRKFEKAKKFVDEFRAALWKD